MDFKTLWSATLCRKDAGSRDYKYKTTILGQLSGSLKVSFTAGGIVGHVKRLYYGGQEERENLEEVLTFRI